MAAPSQRLVIFGPPGAGKGTQARLLRRRRGFTTISTGRILRQAIDQGTPTGKLARHYMKAGDLVPDEVVRTLAEEAMAATGLRGFVLDGYPRTIQQAEWLDQFLQASERPLDAVIQLELADDEVVARLSRRRVYPKTGENFHLDFKPPPPELADLVIQRSDDQPAAILQRVRTYHAETRPVAGYFAEGGLVRNVEANGSIEDVHDRVCSVLDAL